VDIPESGRIVEAGLGHERVRMYALKGKQLMQSLNGCRTLFTI
jgi:hypothetical protein